MSTAMIGAAPATRAPWMLFSPTPPQPITTTLDPVPTAAVLTTAPIPVMTPQAISEALSSGISRGMSGDLAGVDDDMLGEGADPHAVNDRRAAMVGERALAVEREDFLAEHRRALGAGRAEAAGANQRRDDRIADFQTRDAGADAFDHARRLVAVDRGQFAAPGAVEKVDVAVADRAGGDLYPHFAGAGIGELDLFDAERRSELAAYGGPGLHVGSCGRRRENQGSPRPSGKFPVAGGKASAASRRARRIFV